MKVSSSVTSEGAAPSLATCLGLNRGGYRGETIEIAPILTACLAAAAAHRWTTDQLTVEPGLSLTALRRPAVSAIPDRSPFRLYVSAGIHGDEPAGPLAALQLLQTDPWPAGVSLWICPCLNPSGFGNNQRENRVGIDLNRDYRHLRTREVQAHVAWLEQQPAFDLTLCLHEDWEAQGFYLYELNPDRQPSLADRIITSVHNACPIDPSALIDARPAAGGIIRPDLDPARRPDWAEAFYLIQHKTRHSYTLEAPSDFPLSIRVAALVAGVRAILGAITGSGES